MTFKKGDTYRNKFGWVITIIEEPDKLNQVTARAFIGNVVENITCVNAESLENMLTVNGYERRSKNG